jgi:hypothetical protein
LYFETYGGGWFMEDTTWIKSYNSKPVYIGVANANSVGIGTNGRVGIGIGTSTPSYPLVVRGGVSWGGSSTRYYYNVNRGAEGGWPYAGGSFASGTGWSFTLCADFNNYIWATGYTVSSDERIKKNIREVDDAQALKLVRDISCCYYNYIDDVNRGDKTQIGFIAQLVAKVFPIATSLVSEFIPNEFRNLDDVSWDIYMYDNSGNLIKEKTTDELGNIYIKIDISGNEETKILSETETIKYRCIMKSPSLGVVSGVEYKFMCSDISGLLQKNYNTEGIIAEKEIVVIGKEDNSFEFEITMVKNKKLLT